MYLLMLNSAKLWTLKFYYWSKFYLQFIFYQKIRGIRQWISVVAYENKKKLNVLKSK